MNHFPVAFIAAVLAMPSTMLADDPQRSAKPSPLETVLQRSALAAASGEWKEVGWADRQLESSLSELIDDLRSLTKNNQIELPVTFDEVRPVISRDGAKIAHLNNGLFVTKRGKVSHARDSIIIADESIEVSHAHRCLIITRGAVDVGGSSRNVIIAGHFIHTSFDGEPDARDQGGAQGSVLISRSVVDVSHANDTIVCAPLAATMSFSTNSVFINSSNRNISHERNSTDLKDESGALPTSSPQHQLTDELVITRIVAPDDSGNGARVETKHAGVEHAIGIDEVIPDATTELLGWKLVFVGDGFALFAKDGQYASAYLSARNETSTINL